MGRKSTIKKTLSEKITDELDQLIFEEKMTQQELVNWLGERGFETTLRVINRYCAKINHRFNYLIKFGISTNMAKKYYKDCQVLGRLLIHRELLTEASQLNEKKINNLKAKIPFFDKGVDQ